MKKIWTRLSLMFIAMLPGSACANVEHRSERYENDAIDTSTIRYLDVSRYMGKWYEIVRYENRFERGLSQVSATYTMNNDGSIHILNEGFRDGKQYKAVGKGKYPKPESFPGHLKVSFFLWFYSDYYILELDEAYTYAVVGSSSNRFLWILYRKPVMPQSLLAELIRRSQFRRAARSELWSSPRR